MPAKSLPPPPPRPDPVTLDQILRTLTAPVGAPGSSLQEKAYCLVALGAVAFHPSVKIFLFEDAEDPATVAAEGSAPDLGSAPQSRLRRESVLKSVAFFLAQRNNAVSEECRWETVALLGELCRMESADGTGGGSGSGSSSNNNNNNSPNANNNAETTLAPAASASLTAKLNHYAKLNLEYLAQLPWFVPAANALLDAAATSKGNKAERGADGSRLTSSSSSDGTAPAQTCTSATPPVSREELRQRLRQRRSEQAGDAAGEHALDAADGNAVSDEDALIALRDILHALPSKEGVWTSDALAQAHDLMFIDASTTLLHLIPIVSRSRSDVCAMCLKKNVSTSPSSSPAASGSAYLRCSSCKAVFYCSAACQRQHWGVAHRQSCTLFKEKRAESLAEYYRLNDKNKKAKGGRAKKPTGAAEDDADSYTVLEVPLEPSLFYETRRYLFDHRDRSFARTDFYDYFMKYTVHGN